MDDRKTGPYRRVVLCLGSNIEPRAERLETLAGQHPVFARDDGPGVDDCTQHIRNLPFLKQNTDNSLLGRRRFTAQLVLQRMTTF